MLTIIEVPLKYFCACIIKYLLPHHLKMSTINLNHESREVMMNIINCI